MNSPIPQILLPPVASLDVPGILNVWAQNLNRTLNEFIQRATTQLNSQVQGVGTILASADTLMPTHPIHKVSGSHSPVRSIHVPPGFTGPLFLTPTGSWAWDTSGNIALSGTAVVGKLLIMVYDGTAWYPSYT
jgi:hypothetical protein